MITGSAKVEFTTRFTTNNKKRNKQKSYSILFSFSNKNIHSLRFHSILLSSVILCLPLELNSNAQHCTTSFVCSFQHLEQICTFYHTQRHSHMIHNPHSEMCLLLSYSYYERTCMHELHFKLNRTKANQLHFHFQLLNISHPQIRYIHAMENDKVI